MITSDKQYSAAKEQLAMLINSLNAAVNKDVPKPILEAGKKQQEELIEEIKGEIEEYEMLKNSDASEIEIHSLDDLVNAPIRYRISKRMSIDTFSRKVGVSPRQISRYERESYKNINTSTLLKILSELNIRLDGKINDAQQH